jgi:hypothetical protein
MSSAPKTIAVDFDGVIHRYSLGWQDGTTYDTPMQDAAVSLERLMSAGYRVVVFSTRDPIQIQDWFEAHMPLFNTRILADHERFFNDQGVIGITRHKPVAFAYIDDRAIHFQTWDMALAELCFRVAEEKPKK